MTDSFRLEGFLPYQVAVLSGYFRDEFALICSGFGIRINDWRALALVAEHLGTPAIELAARAHLDQVAVHRAIKRLTARGLVLTRESTDDRRCKPLVLSRTGQALYERIVPAAHEFERCCLASLSAAEERTLRTLLRKLLAELGIPALRARSTRRRSITAADLSR